MTAASATGNVEIYGMQISGNVIPCVTFAQDSKCGAFVLKDMMKGEMRTPEMLAVNPWGQMPSMKDGDFCLAESNAILRYLANCYNIQAYGGSDAQKRAMIDWAMDWVSTNFMTNYFKYIWYPVAGFGSPASDQAKVNQECNSSLDLFEKKFLPNKKFIGGENMNIADYKLGCLLWYLSHPAVKAKSGYELPKRYKTYVDDYVTAMSPESQKFLDAGKAFLNSKQ
eukprot:CAMPEP_0198539234 /NCGR_PEP_ID=MMETSP1462-20131121/48299_1 /TAXON_ID=1333877 /ORGANISM="Brandtodinium nutriculum, Strain RCC3387" /LENGTH=224 /DNA_ID=CAMNT_0044269283 /DNA_START=158 /DNA_END=832 /DNA_ORIENTATION=-